MTETRGRVAQLCDECQQVDTHPRHSHANASGALVSLHFDCCAARGCPLAGTEQDAQACGNLLQAFPEGARHGDKLVAHVTSEQGTKQLRKLNQDADREATRRELRRSADMLRQQADDAQARLTEIEQEGNR